MKTLVTALSIVLYTALAFGANIARADYKEIDDMRTGAMEKLSFHDEARAVSEHKFRHPDGRLETFEAYRGKFVLVNFWAVWCTPCRREIPSLSRLQTALGGEDFTVLTIATGFGGKRQIARFFDEIGVENLSHAKDYRNKIAADMGVSVLPITVLLDPEGREIARLSGEAEWDSAPAKALIRAAIAHYKTRHASAK